MKKNFENSSESDGKTNPESEKPPLEQYRSRIAPQDIVMMLIGKWAMPTTVVLVLVTCLSGYFLDFKVFIAVLGIISPVIMALVMVIKEASVGRRSKRNSKK
ncbi:hypothetical protein [Pseudoalteromonas ostreae]|uniref:hypothetical protein n=1 Tax=Pseudoalteromonas ostreae TaxID=2774154 RepID=UPI001B38835C|nr:hypothetical protein [Pseudoalteromonas ostreae]